MAQQQNNLKGNPAAKRMGNPRDKALRAQCWARGQRRKAARVAAQAAREAQNNELRAAGLLTKWEASKAARRNRRA